MLTLRAQPASRLPRHFKLCNRIKSTRSVICSETNMKLTAVFLFITALLCMAPNLFITAPLQAMSQNKTTTTTADELLLTKSEASHFAKLALKCVTKEYPNKLDHTINDGNDVKS